MEKSRINHNLISFKYIELLFMIAIIAILVAMRLPALNKTGKRDRTINCITNTKRLTQVSPDCADNYNGKGIYTKVFYAEKMVH